MNRNQPPSEIPDYGRSKIERQIGTTVLYQSNVAMFRNDPFRFSILIFMLIISLIMPWFMIQSLGLALPIIIMVMFAFFLWWWSIKGTRVTITKEYIRVRHGIFNREITQIFIQDITKFRVYQTFWQRIMNVGTVEVSSSASAETEIMEKGLPRPRDILVAINSNR